MNQGKRILLVTLSIVAIAGSIYWIRHQQRRVPTHNIPLHTAVGQVMAKETARLAGNKGKVVVLSIDTSGEPELKTQLRAFEDTLRALGDYHIKDEIVDTKGQTKYRLGGGLSARRFVRLVNKSQDAAVVVSFIGAPEMEDEDLKELPARMPRFIAEIRSTDHLPELFEKKLIEVAVVSRFEFPSPGTDDPKTPEEWFIKRYQVVTPQDSARLPKPE